ncbi:MAG TPA: glycosyltransferase [Thermosynechococcaceae cyanobacterium]
MSDSNPHIAFFLGSFGGSGIGRIATHSFVRAGVGIDLVLSRGESPHLWQMPTETRIVGLKQPRLSTSLSGLVKYLRQGCRLVLAADHYLNEIALLAGRIAEVPTKVAVAKHNQLSKITGNASKLKAQLVPLFARFLYLWADGIVAVLQGVADHLDRAASLSLASIQTIYNPVITPEILASAQESVDHPWFNTQDVPEILGVGRLEAQKDFPNLIRASTKVRQARFVILGWGFDRPQLEALVQALGLQEDLDLPGYAQNSYACTPRSTVFVLSSAWEGLPTVLIEAMALGKPVVSTDCESGPAEILAGGRYGYLTPVGNSDAGAEAISQVLAGKHKAVDSSWLEQFNLEAATAQYLKALGIQPFPASSESQRISL